MMINKNTKATAITAMLLLGGAAAKDRTKGARTEIAGERSLPTFSWATASLEEGIDFAQEVVQFSISLSGQRSPDFEQFVGGTIGEIEQLIGVLNSPENRRLVEAEDMDPRKLWYYPSVPDIDEISKGVSDGVNKLTNGVNTATTALQQKTCSAAETDYYTACNYAATACINSCDLFYSLSYCAKQCGSAIDSASFGTCTQAIAIRDAACN